MKKWILFLFLLLITVGCNKKIKMEVFTNVIKNDDYSISINYPKTNIRKLNNALKKDIKTTVDNFKNIIGEQKELNIDYTYNVVNENYINITITIFTSIDNKQENKINTYVFDRSKGKFLKLNQIVKDIKKYQDIANDKFIFDNDYIYFFSILNNEIIQKKFNIDKNTLLFEIQTKDDKEVFNVYSPVINEIDYNNPVIALTFDDGPSKYTDKILDLLSKNNCKATFFVLGNKVIPYKKSIRKAIDLGNEIGNHTYNHRWLSRLNNDEITTQITRTQDILKDNLSYTPNLLRPTYGSINNKIRKNTNLEIVLWTVDTLDWKIKDSKKIANKAISKIKNGSIILMHDTHERTYKALEIIIPELKKKGYQFVTVSELNEIKKLKKDFING